MGDRLSLVESKVEAVLELVEKIKAEKKALLDENDQLKIELAQLRKQVAALKVDKAEQGDNVRTRLELILNRVDELESLAG